MYVDGYCNYQYYFRVKHTLITEREDNTIVFRTFRNSSHTGSSDKAITLLSLCCPGSM